MMQNQAKTLSAKNIVRKSHPMWVNPQSANTSSPVVTVVMEPSLSDKDFYCSERATD